jgi:hypothetical protein
MSFGSSNVWFTVGAVLAAFPFGYMAGLLAAFLLAGGHNIGQAPLLTVPLGLLAATVFAAVPLLAARTRFAILLVGAIALWFLAARVIV